MNEQMAGNFGPIIMMVLMIAIFYFLLIRPQKKKEKKLRDMIAALKVGDEVASIGGIHGKITRIKDDIFVLETGVGTTKSYISIERSAIARMTKAAATGLTTLCAYRGLTPVMLCGDFMLTESFLRSKFGVNTRRMIFADRTTRETLLAIEPE